jgi:hypothetical protein
MGLPLRWGTVVLLGLMCAVAPMTWASTIKLAWDVPTLNADGSPLTDLAGYRLTFCVGGTCNPNVGGTDITPDLGLVTTYLHTGLTPGTDYRYAIRAKDSSGELSTFSYQAEGRAPAGDLVAVWFRNDTGSSTTATDGGWFDYSGQLCQGATCPQQTGMWVTGQINTALHCDGVNDHVVIPHNAAMDLVGDMSLAFWVRLLSTTNLTAGVPVAGKEATTPGLTPWWVGIFNPSTPNFHWYQLQSGGLGNGLTFTSYTIPLNIWRHITFVRVASTRTVTLYVSGISTQALTYPVNDGPQASGAVVQFCVDVLLSGTRYAHIDVDEFRMYDYAIPQSLITQIAIAPAAPGGVRLQ